jgi:hypothetical protein
MKLTCHQCGATIPRDQVMHAALSEAGSTTSKAKAAAARANGKLGGRPPLKKRCKTK